MLVDTRIAHAGAIAGVAMILWRARPMPDPGNEPRSPLKVYPSDYVAPGNVAGKFAAKVGIGAAALIVAMVGAFEGKRNDPPRHRGVWTVCYGETNVAMRRYSDAECKAMFENSPADYAGRFWRATRTTRARSAIGRYGQPGLQYRPLLPTANRAWRGCSAPAVAHGMRCFPALVLCRGRQVKGPVAPPPERTRVLPEGVVMPFNPFSAFTSKIFGGLFCLLMALALSHCSDKRHTAQRDEARATIVKMELASEQARQAQIAANLQPQRLDTEPKRRKPMQNTKGTGARS